MPATLYLLVAPCSLLRLTLQFFLLPICVQESNRYVSRGARIKADAALLSRLMVSMIQATGRNMQVSNEAKRTN